MKKFIATEQNIQQIMGEMNKVLMKNHYWGHHFISTDYTRKNGKRPKHIHIAGRQKQYFTVLAERTDPMMLCDINYDTDSSFDYLTVVTSGDIVMIDADRVYIITKQERNRFVRGKKVVSRIVRVCHSIIPATEATAETWGDYSEEETPQQHSRTLTVDGMMGPFTMTE